MKKKIVIEIESVNFPYISKVDIKKDICAICENASLAKDFTNEIAEKCFEEIVYVRNKLYKGAEFKEVLI